MSETRSLIDDLGGRRFLLALGCAWVSTGLLMGGYVSETIYRDLILYTVAAYITGNTAQKVISRGYRNERNEGEY